VQTLPRERRKLVTSHDTLGYLAHRYGFEVLGTVLASFSTEATDPSGAEIAALVDRIKAARVPAMFAENVHTPRLPRCSPIVFPV
jgi:zinc/manganese transport system substrate-binding protein